MALPSAPRPVIGISTRINPTENTNYLRQSYAQAIYAAGGTPILIPLIPEAAYVQAVVQRLDGVLLTGSNSDVDPARYGQAPHIHLGDVYPERDETDFLLLSAAEARNLPTLGICFGLQIMNVYRGGTLFQDLPSQVENVMQHRQSGSRDRTSHSIQIDRESLLAKLAGGTSARVNSTHHQAIDEIGKDLRAVAWAADGVIEAAVSVRPGHFMMGVQWHPELTATKDALSQGIFKHFIAEAALQRG
jgi:putative glutamine amidotransferase